MFFIEFEIKQEFYYCGKSKKKQSNLPSLMIFCTFADRFQHTGVMTKYPIGLQNFQGLRED